MPMTKRYEMIKAYQDLWCNHLKFMQKFIEYKKKEEITLEDINAIEKLSAFTDHFGTKSGYFKKEFIEYFGMEMIGKYVFHQFIELVYWITITVMAFNLPTGIGILFYIFMMILSYLTQKNEKASAENKIRYLYIADTLICVVVYIMIIFAYH